MSLQYILNNKNIRRLSGKNAERDYHHAIHKQATWVTFCRWNGTFLRAKWKRVKYSQFEIFGHVSGSRQSQIRSLVYLSFSVSKLSKQKQYSRSSPIHVPKLNFSIQIDCSFYTNPHSSCTSQNQTMQRPGQVPWRFPKGPNIRDLQGNFRGRLGDQHKNLWFNEKSVF